MFALLILAYSFNVVATTLTISCLAEQTCIELNPRQADIQAVNPYYSYVVNGVLFASMFLLYYIFMRLWPKHTIYLVPALLFILSFSFLDMFNDILVTLDTHHSLAYAIQGLFGYV